MSGFEDMHKPSLAEVVKAAGSITDDVITFGEMFNFGMNPEPDLPEVDPECSNLWHAHPSVMEFVEGAASSLLGGSYAALHLRRGDFYEYVSDAGKVKGSDLAKGGFLSATDAAIQMKERMLEVNVTSLYVATNARSVEVEIFRRVLEDGVKSSGEYRMLTLGDLLTRTDWLSQQTWAAKALKLETSETKGLLYSLIDKFMCVKATHFWGSRGSTFSLEIGFFQRGDETKGLTK